MILLPVNTPSLDSDLRRQQEEAIEAHRDTIRSIQAMLDQEGGPERYPNLHGYNQYRIQLESKIHAFCEYLDACADDDRIDEAMTFTQWLQTQDSSDTDEK